MIGITLTGADERTPLVDLAKLAHHGAEIGLLYTFSPDGRNRYPSLKWLAGTILHLKRRCAIHICGSRARQQLYNGDLDWLIHDVGRIQVNGHLDPAWVARVCQRYSSKTIITQHNAQNLWLLPVESPNHALLVDESGGRAMLPESWTRPNTDKPVGFAGGLGPSTLRENLPRIASAANGCVNGWWVDMEGRLRDEQDWFSVELAEKAMAVWMEWKDGLLTV